MDEIAAAFVAAVIGIAIFIAGGFVGHSSFGAASLTDCAKRHNVYACKLVAVPAEPAKLTIPRS